MTRAGRNECLNLVLEIMRHAEQHPHVYTPAEMEAYEKMRRFAATGQRYARPS